MNRLLPGDILIDASGGWGSPLARQVFEPSAGVPVVDGSVLWWGNTSSSSNARTNIAVSPDGRKIALTQGETGTRVAVYDIEAETLTVTPVDAAGAPVISSVVWSPDSLEFAVPHANSPFISRYSAAGVQLVPPSVPPTNTPSNAEYSPDGRFLAVWVGGSTASDHNQLRVYDRLNGLTSVSIGTIVSSGTGVVTTSPVSGAAFSEDSSKLWAVSTSATQGAGFFGFFDTSTWVWTPLPLPSGRAGSSQTRIFLSISPDDKYLLMGDGATSWPGRMILLDVSNPTSPVGLEFVDYPGDLQSYGAFRGVRWLGTSTFMAVITPVGRSFFRDFGAGPIVWELGQDLKCRYAETPANAAWVVPGNYWYCVGVMPGGERRRFAGLVKDLADNPLVRTVRAVNRRTGRIIGETVSDVSGAFEIQVMNSEPAIVYCVGDNAEVVQLEDSVVPVSIT